MSDIPSDRFILLMTFITDISSKVLGLYLDIKHLNKEGLSLSQFLDEIKLDVYRTFGSRVGHSTCGHLCAKGHNIMDNNIFRQLYEIKQGGTCSNQNGNVCIESIIPKQAVSLENLDISVLNLLRSRTSLKENENIDTIVSIRNAVSHANNTNASDLDLIDQLERSTLRLASEISSVYENLMRHYIQLVRNTVHRRTRTIEIQQENLSVRIEIVPKDSNERLENPSGDTRTVEVKVTSDALDEEMEKKAVKRLRSTPPGDNNDKFSIIKSKVECIFLQLSAHSSLFKHEETLWCAIRSLVGRVIKAGEIDTSKKSTMEVRITFTSPLTNDERKMVESMLFNKTEERLLPNPDAETAVKGTSPADSEAIGSVEVTQEALIRLVEMLKNENATLKIKNDKLEKKIKSLEPFLDTDSEEHAGRLPRSSSKDPHPSTSYSDNTINPSNQEEGKEGEKKMKRNN